MRPISIRILPDLKSLVFLPLLLAAGIAAEAPPEMVRLESASLSVEINKRTGSWALTDAASSVRWPSDGFASPGSAPGLSAGFDSCETPTPRSATLRTSSGLGVTFEIADEGRALALRYAIVPCREGLLVPAASGKEFRRTFGTSEYEGCHMNMLGFIKSGSALIVTWDDAYVFPEVHSAVPDGEAAKGSLSATFTLRRSARSVQLVPIGKGDWNAIASNYRRIASEKRLAATLREKIRRNLRAELMVGAANVKLWTCLARRMNEESTAEESVTVRWTFDEAAQIAEHLNRDLGLARCLFILGGWTEGGYDCRHPDNLPANPECGGNEALARAIERIRRLGFVACLHDNYQDMYRDAKSWDPKCIEKRPDGSLITGGRWLGGRAFMVCAPRQLELARRPQNLPGIRQLFPAWAYFIDTTYAVGPRECADPEHPIGRNDDIAWKAILSDYARETFGLFGSECGREWALPHSDFFEGLVGVSGRHFHSLDPAELGAIVIPFWEMVYHDCQVCYGKYGYRADRAADYVAAHVLCARPLHYHSIPDHLYWKTAPPQEGWAIQEPEGSDLGCYLRCDQGWGAGLHPVDVFLKNTHEVLGPLNAATAGDVLTEFSFATADRSVRQAVYGRGAEATRVIVNCGAADAEVATQAGGLALLPEWGFVVEAPAFAAFYAKRWGSRSYPRGALFTVQALDGGRLLDARRIRVFHGFGDPTIEWKGATYQVDRDKTIDLRSGDDPRS